MMITLHRLRFFLTIPRNKHKTNSLLNEHLNFVSQLCLAPERTVYSNGVKGVSPPYTVKGHPTVNFFSTLEVNRLCWKCGSSAGLFFCSICNIIQPPDNKANYFDILKCDQMFSLDAQRLQQRYLELQRSLHPDSFSQKSLKEQQYSEEQSALVNKAYRTLQKPLSRAVYMLELRGVFLEEGTDATADPAFLQQVMELNESLAETQSPEEIRAIGSSVKEKLKDLTAQMNLSLNKGDLHSAKVVLNQMKYFTNIQEKVKERSTEPC
ncbi:hypothetical protein DNTS_005940 [Danionella cerebrum]|uniref:J domain-containing protein n=1 Tax=Danionella cerebrum TaxID=2873325 RepID=A0A553R3D1_9TELE|nr:hypothetical protein DNTS_005940 [Danionella translucida]